MDLRIGVGVLTTLNIHHHFLLMTRLIREMASTRIAKNEERLMYRNTIETINHKKRKLKNVN